MPSSFSQFRPLLSALTLATFATLSGCGGNSNSPPQSTEMEMPNTGAQALRVLGVMNLDPADCVAKAERSAPMLNGGIMDLAFRLNYAAFLLVENHLPSPATETEGVALRSAEITLTTLDGVVLAKHASVATGFIAATPASAAYAAVSVDLIPSAVVSAEPVRSAGSMLAKIRVLGDTLNGARLTSDELPFPIRTCTGCLVEYPASAADPLQPSGSGYRCSASAAAGSGLAPEPCFLGQDAPFSCAHCASSFALCQDPAKNPSL